MAEQDLLTIAGRSFGSRLITGTGGAANLPVLDGMATLPLLLPELADSAEFHELLTVRGEVPPVALRVRWLVYRDRLPPRRRPTR